MWIKTAPFNISMRIVLFLAYLKAPHVVKNMEDEDVAKNVHCFVWVIFIYLEGGNLE